MADRSLRGMKLGSYSMESDEGVVLAPRVEAIYDCPDGQVIVIPFSAEADIPPVWEAPGGGEALLRDAERPEPTPGRKVRTHWDMLLERRTMDDLQEVFDERLALLRSGQLRRKIA